ncbi:unnamed protein product [Candidula unifasciata]|uniref:StAR-related lipid transfer protein 3 n=1 Tax=Candidula unifasciata TaxID=100452 RepID=A0A8S3Z9R1_9EUPU|nr:unnamed protein product [Candidula unifasciata]
MSINADVAELPQSQDEQYKYASSVIHSGVPGTVMPPIISVTDTSTAPLLTPSHMTEGRISSVRRTFCLFVLFDLILIFILWVIYTQLIGEAGFHAFETQVRQYSFQTSLFDTVMLSAVRFTLLILAYALFRINHWWTVALCTAMSCAVLIAKIFLFDFQGTRSSSNPLSYCLIIISFVLAWLEAWFLDFKVLPQEKKQLERIAHSHNRDYGSTLISPRVHFPPGDDIQSVITEDNQYYSPLDSPEGSDNENEAGAARSLASQDNDYVKVARHSWDVLWIYVNSPETDWKLESDSVETGGIIHSRRIKGVGKVYRLKAVVNMPPKDLFEELMFKPEEHHLWNSSIQTSKVLQVVDSHTDIVYNVSAEIGGGVIANRDFVSIRTWGCQNGVFMGSGMAVTHPSMPPQKNVVRGTNGVGGWVFKPFPGDGRRTLFFWYMNTDIKGWFPQKLVDANMVKVIEDFCKDLHAHVQRIST